MCKKVLGRKTNKTEKKATFSNPVVLTRDQHPVSRKHISTNALKVLYRLNKGGYDAYLVGGGVRDIILGLEPKDFDIATNATPEQIKELFRNCRLIGRRFRLAHIVFGRDVIEVATFRGHHDNNNQEKAKGNQKISKQSEHGMLLRDNIYGSIEEDAERRDFSINALYYSVTDFKVYDFANGVEDVHNRIIRLIGDPETRYREDPVRMLRAIRFATKLDMTISEETQAPIAELAPLLANIPAARMFEEFNKLFLSGKARANFDMLRDYGLFQYFFPVVEQNLEHEENIHLNDFIRLALKNTDLRINNNQRVTPAFLLAAMLWYPLQARIQRLNAASQLTPQDAFFAAYNELISEQQRSISIPKRFQLVMKDIWILQDKLARRDGKRAYKSFEHPKFRAGYDFLLLRGEIEGGPAQELAKWWTDFQSAHPETQQQMIKAVAGNRPGGRRSTRKRKKPGAQSADKASSEKNSV
ncbi:polynucleotide adenylyltransferase PcnB [Thalassomonas sp. RHCl1]|uniref:polynucleotide adenylyltransferase PcnB n=1 Tax=Thalassomonas sp. RHCl1 TaxID=2995320 RepID=UPI00248C25CF|nr:polynucleotide adenylyltransferase PcnB [Thalassomonas sp. RHCl1]